MSDPTNPFQNRNELKDHFEIKRLRAELAAEREAKQCAVDAAETYREERDACIKEVAEAGKRQGQAEAERDALRAVVQAAFDMQISNHPEWEALARAAVKETNHV